MANFRIYNDTLCPDLWDSAQHLDPKARINLLRMAYDFYEKTNLPAPIMDVYLMGSISNYNWTTDSDIDVHVIIDYNKLQMPKETGNKTVKTAGAQWNQEHNILVKRHKVEMNLQNASEPKPYVTGIYSLVNDQWVRKPTKVMPQLDRGIIKMQYKSMKAYIDNALQSGNREQMKGAKKYLDAYRQYGLDTYGELSYENIIFKILRARGIIKQLKDSITAVYDKEMSVDEADFIGSTYMGQLKGVEVPDATRTVHNDHSMISGVNSQNWRYLQNKNRVLWNTKPTESDKVAVTQWLFQRGIINPNHKVMHGESVDEVSSSDLKHSLPDFAHGDAPDNPELENPRFDRSLWDKQDYKGGDFRFDRLTMDELNALRAKASRMVKGTSGNSNPTAKEINRNAMQDYIRYNAEINRRLEIINRPIVEMPQISKKGTKVMAGDEPLKGQTVEKVIGNVVVIRQGTGGGFIPEGWTLVYFMDSEEAAEAMKKGEIPYLMVPTGTFHSGGSPITDIWKRRFQKPGHEHILGVLQGHSDTESIFVDMLTVRPGYQRNHIAKLMVDRLRKTFLDAKITTSSRTDKGEKFAKGYGIDEGVGAGIPEDDRLKIKNSDGSTRRWQVRSKNAPKTPKFTDTPPRAIEKFDKPQET